MRFEHLSDWLRWQEGLHPSTIDLGLDRLRAVMQRLDWQAPRCPVITIAGTKGKGSCAAILDSMLRAGGYRTGMFSSPHLRRYNERIHIAGKEVSDATLCAAFERIDTARGDISLTYFEFNALAAFVCFAAADLDVWVLEVGLGGRLDAANAIDADVAIVTSIGLDHTEWLGNDLDSIGREKAGICRAGRPLLFGSMEMPVSIEQVATQRGAQLLRAGGDFSHRQHEQSWSWQMGQQRFDDLPLPALAGAVQVANASCALAALQLLQARLPMTRAAITTGLRNVHLDGRFQRIEIAGVQWVLDVAHNALSAAVLAEQLACLPRRRTLALFGVMADKDAMSMVELLRDQIDGWWAVGLDSPRALPVAQLLMRLQSSGVSVLGSSDDTCAALAAAQAKCAAGEYQRVLVFGSFLIVAPALDYFDVSLHSK